MNTWIAAKDLIKHHYLRKMAFYSELNLEDITDKNYDHAQKVWELFEIKNLGEYHELHVQCYTLLVANVLENFKDKCIEIYELDPAHGFFCLYLNWQGKLAQKRLE